MHPKLSRKLGDVVLRYKTKRFIDDEDEIDPPYYYEDEIFEDEADVFDEDDIENEEEDD
jgi:hypothetical protein